MRRTRVLMLVNRLRSAGGAESFVVGLASNLPRERFDVRVAMTRTGSGGRLIDLLDDAGVPHFDIGRSSRLNLFAFRRLTRRLRDQRIDVLHAHKFGSNMWGALAGTAARVPAIVAHEHSWAYRGQPLRRLIDGQLIGRLSDAFVATCEADRKRMVSIEHVPRSKTFVIPAAYIPRPHTPSFDLRAELNIRSDEPIIGTVAMLRQEKAIDRLIRAFARVLEQFPTARLVIVGDGPCRHSLEQLCEQMGLASRVVLAGIRFEIDSVLDAFNVAVISSDREGTPLLAFESMAHKTPLVATRVGGIPDIYENGRTALLVSPGSDSELANALVALLSDPRKASAMADAAAQRLDTYTIENVARQVGDLYDRVLDSKRACG